jgi:hypothetical protein
MDITKMLAELKAEHEAVEGKLVFALRLVGITMQNTAFLHD